MSKRIINVTFFTRCVHDLWGMFLHSLLKAFLRIVPTYTVFDCKHYSTCVTSVFPRSLIPFFWVVMQRKLIVSCRRFGTTYRPRLQGSSNPLLGFWRWDRYVVSKRRSLTTNVRCLTSQKGEDLINGIVSWTYIVYIYHVFVVLETRLRKRIGPTLRRPRIEASVLCCSTTFAACKSESSR